MSVSRREVLVVSSDAGTNQEVLAALADTGLDITVLLSPEPAFERFLNTPPALVLLSMTTASVLLPLIREQDADIPVILMPTADAVADVVPLLTAGASDYILFPVAHPSLVRYGVQKNLERRRELRKRRRAERELKKLNRTLVDSLQLLQRDQQAGFLVQQSMMPDTPFRADGLTLRHLIVPSLILSGDFIDYFELPDRRLLFYIADVSGHGASGAIVTVLLKSLSGRLCNEFEDLGLRDTGEILEWFNQELLACHVEQHATMFLGVVDQIGQHLQYASAGHFPASILSSQDQTRYLEMGGLPLGIYPNARYRSREVDLPETFTMVMFSDGVFEIMPEETLKAKEAQLLSLVKSDLGDLELMADHLGLSTDREVPDDIAVFTVARAG